MKLTSLILCCGAIAISAAHADMLVRTTNQQVHRIPVEAADVISIEFTSSPPPSSTTSPPSEASTSRRWVETAKPSHYFVSVKGSHPIQWLEYSDGNVAFRFVQEGETPNYVRIYDNSRKVTVWLYDDQFKWRNNKGKSGVARGSWQ